MQYYFSIAIVTYINGYFSVSFCLQEFKKLLSHPYVSKLASELL